ncbi:hypothetical protein DVW31_15820, partial [Enterococcus faecium]|uniref:hypothetical protein n=1 Tax=Enterococcus faecium TaxID=1352 RepID=UPI00113C66CD
NFLRWLNLLLFFYLLRLTNKKKQEIKMIERFVGELDCRQRMSGGSRIFLDFWQFLTIFADFTLKNTLFVRSLWRALQLGPPDIRHYLSDGRVD